MSFKRPSPKPHLNRTGSVLHSQHLQGTEKAHKFFQHKLFGPHPKPPALGPQKKVYVPHFSWERTQKKRYINIDIFGGFWASKTGSQTGHFGPQNIFIHLQCWEVLPFLTIQRQRCIKFRVFKEQTFYTPLALNCQKGQHLPALEVYKKSVPHKKFSFYCFFLPLGHFGLQKV